MRWTLWLCLIGGTLRGLPPCFANLNPQLLNEAKTYWANNPGLFPNKNYIAIVDFAKASSESRFYLVNMTDSSVQEMHVAHGSGSDPYNTGFAKRFSNQAGTHASSLGFYQTGQIVVGGKHGIDLILKGLSPTNSHALSRSILVHPAAYVDETGRKVGRSWGCFALTPSLARTVMDKIKDGALIYAAKEDEPQIKGAGKRNSRKKRARL